MPSAPSILVFSSGGSGGSDRAFCKFAEFLGLNAELVQLPADCSKPPAELLKIESSRRILALGHAALSSLFQEPWFAEALNEFEFGFVYGFAPGSHDSPELRWLTRNALTAVGSTAGSPTQFAVHANVTYGDFPVSGRSFSCDSGPFAIFSGADPTAGIESYITANGHPCFVSVQRGRSLLFLLAGPVLVDIDDLIAPNASLRPWYAQLIAMSIVLRSAGRSWCWTSPITPANFVIDDPWLKPRYGFVNYETLLPEIEKNRFALTIAFIPYNQRSSDPNTVALVRRHADRFSIAVHGCDHTDSEFAGSNEDWLVGTTDCALDRMRDHEQQTGMPFDNVMVFPQGLFSLEAIRAAKACGLTAAVNSDAWPVDNEKKPLRIRDLLEIAITCHDNFPIFLRRYPLDLFDRAFDALFQKSIFGVEHHGFFRHGSTALINFVRELSTVKTNLVWMPLGLAVASSCVLRQVGDGKYVVRHVTPVLRLKNPTSADWQLSLEKPESNGSVKAVMVDGRETTFVESPGWLKYEAHLAANAELNVRVIYHEVDRVKRKPSWKFRIKVAVRRKLTDFRDNQVARSAFLLALTEKMKRRLLGKGSPAGPKKS